MKVKRKVLSPALAKGQLWKIDNAYILIVELGKRLIQYKMLRQQGQKAVRTQMAAIDTLKTYLQDNSATLVQ
jgi:hypothetical protein